ncbi:putative transmembrane region and signal peptide protein [Rhodopirellula islandica]|uniref:Transmembrane region and signal peptide protein n=1 Tax=Rhodopirellula islandica TaxID=595434 RepID=A0A0J1B6L8_RHOIS|nr:DUF1559 domain-containing protein [Rhodopirellula islandica]KLU02445.1 putative transmembrane region and signal peptide protein [Rhodopirellula islandica]
MKSKLSFIDLVIVGVMASVGFSLLLPAILRQRAAARNALCASNLKALGLAMHNYHAAFNQLPPGLGGTVGGEDDTCNQGRLGPIVGFTPFLEQQALWEKIANPYVSPKTGKRFPPMGPAPWFDAAEYDPWASAFSTLRCPDDMETQPETPKQEPIVVTTLAMPDLPPGAIDSTTLCNYVMCYGDGTYLMGEMIDINDVEAVNRVRAGMRGAFCGNQRMRFRDMLDGLSNTIGMSETISPGINDAKESHIAQGIKGLSLNPSLCLKTRDGDHADWWDVRRGSRWADGTLAISGFQTVLPPNSPTCLSDLGMEDPIASASSRHPGGVHALMLDGRVVFIGDSIDCGDPSQPGVSVGEDYARPGSPSPYGVWGALGTRASKEVLPNPNPDLKPVETGPVGNRNGQAQGNDPERRWATWTDRDGKHRLKARVNRIIDRETVELEDSRGILHRVPLNTLSDSSIVMAVTMYEMGLELKAAAKPE